MRRKIVQQGTATLMVSLPAGWVRKNGIEKGAEVEVQEQKDRIIILPTAEALAARIEIDVTGMDDDLLREIEAVEGTKEKKTYDDPEAFKTVRQAMLRMLASLYKAGYDEIRITFEHPGTINLIQQALGDELSEYEIVEQGRNHCVLQDISGVLKERFDPAVRRIFYLLQQMADDSLPLIAAGKQRELGPVRFLETSNNRFTTFCRRLLSKKGHPDPAKVPFLYLIIDRLEMIADQYKYLFDYLLSRPTARIGKAVVTEYARLGSFLREYHEFYAATHEKERLVRLQAMRNLLVRQCHALFDKATTEEKMLLHYILTTTQLIFELMEPTFVLGVNE